MSERTGKGTSAASWDTYWRGSASTGALTAEGASHPSLARFWSDVFRQRASDSDAARCIDIASGTGAVVEAAVASETTASLVCLDISRAALRLLARRFPTTDPVVASADRLPFADKSFDLVTSQFGAEYAGTRAIDEAARVVALGGELVMLVHIRPGIIHSECSASASAADGLIASDFLTLAGQALEKAFLSGPPTRNADWMQREAPLMAAGQALGKLLAEHGRQVAGGMLAEVVDTVSRALASPASFDRDEVLTWLGRLHEEMPAYRERMQSMCAAALDRQAFDALAGRLRSAGFALRRAQPLRPEPNRPPLAWILHAERPFASAS